PSARTSREAELRRRAPRAEVVFARHDPDRLLPDGGPPSDLRGRRVFLLSGIARPDSFERTVASLGAVIVGSCSFPDHHDFTPGEWREAGDAARARGAELLLATGKDEPKLARFGPTATPSSFLEVEVGLGEDGWRRVDALLDRVLKEPARVA